MRFNRVNNIQEHYESLTVRKNICSVPGGRLVSLMMTSLTYCRETSCVILTILSHLDRDIQHARQYPLLVLALQDYISTSAPCPLVIFGWNILIIVKHNDFLSIVCLVSWTIMDAIRSERFPPCGHKIEQLFIHNDTFSSRWWHFKHTEVFHQPPSGPSHAVLFGLWDCEDIPAHLWVQWAKLVRKQRVNLLTCH